MAMGPACDFKITIMAYILVHQLRMFYTLINGLWEGGGHAVLICNEKMDGGRGLLFDTAVLTSHLLRILESDILMSFPFV